MELIQRKENLIRKIINAHFTASEMKAVAEKSEEILQRRKPNRKLKTSKS
jgi:hypothetical protein